MVGLIVGVDRDVDCLFWVNVNGLYGYCLFLLVKRDGVVATEWFCFVGVVVF